MFKKLIPIHNDIEIKGFVDEYKFLSNMFPCEISWNGYIFQSTESAYQASKTTDRKTFKLISSMCGKDAKKYTKSITIRNDWNIIKYNIMAQLVFQKFLIHLPLRNKLLDTNNKYLEETNTWKDVYWGVYEGKGKNNLGKILMNTRTYFNGNI